MYIKKILLAVVLIGLLGMAAFSYFVYVNIFSPNTSFNNQEANVYIPTGASFEDVIEALSPLLKSEETFRNVAKRKQYVDHVKAGHYIIKSGMNNNDIINTIRSNNIAIQVKFNNQERIEDLAGKLGSQLETDSLSFLNAFSEESFLLENDLTYENVLSMYIPNTYEIYWNIPLKI
jgi:Predicted periplasmic solute-binding protein